MHVFDFCREWTWENVWKFMTWPSGQTMRLPPRSRSTSLNLMWVLHTHSHSTICSSPDSIYCFLYFNSIQHNIIHLHLLDYIKQILKSSCQAPNVSENGLWQNMNRGCCLVEAWSVSVIWPLLSIVFDKKIVSLGSELVNSKHYTKHKFETIVFRNIIWQCSFGTLGVPMLWLLLDYLVTRTVQFCCLCHSHHNAG